MASAKVSNIQHVYHTISHYVNDFKVPKLTHIRSWFVALQSQIFEASNLFISKYLHKDASNQFHQLTSAQL